MVQKWRYLISELSKRDQGPECRGNIELLKGMKPIWALYHKQRKNLCKLVGKHSGQKVVNTHIEEYIEGFKKVFSGWEAKWATLNVRKHTSKVRISEINLNYNLEKTQQLETTSKKLFNYMCNSEEKVSPTEVRWYRNQW